ncbi:hypothetical protein MAR_018356 [Mya arenaria]|uniref:Uncharacterized protein n=1 Tax=Mya arenaria TaxID=6604 RepID=A0ABY7EEG0_MYAAR|nr:hypothetical protein MAR_018356 [Mya arenaria]
MLFRPFRDGLELIGTLSTSVQEYKACCKQITHVRQQFQTVTDGIEEAMKAVNEERIQEQLDEIAPFARQSEEDACMAKDDEISLLQPPNERASFYDIGLDLGGSVDTQQVTIPNRIIDEEYQKVASSLNNEQRKFFYEISFRTKCDYSILCIFCLGEPGHYQVTLTKHLGKILTT